MTMMVMAVKTIPKIMTMMMTESKTSRTCVLKVILVGFQVTKLTMTPMVVKIFLRTMMMITMVSLTQVTFVQKAYLAGYL